MAKKDSSSQKAPKSADSRFDSFQTDPRFRLPSKKNTKTKIDKRFSRVLKDEDFTKSAKVDRYGRKVKSDNKTKALKNLYQEESDEEDEQPDKPDDDEKVAKELQKANANYDPARGGGFSSSESDSDSDDEEDEDEGGAIVETTGPMQKLRDEQADVEVGEVTKRFAIVNLDWDHIKSSDLMALMSSFVPKGGRIDKVSIYPSEFGKGRMQREELEGPPKELFKKKKESDESSVDSEDDSEDEDDDEDEDIKKDLIQEGDDADFDSDALRTYQLDRLRYYYAVVLCSDEATAENIYKAVDGTEYQTSSNFMDLRFIPDEVTFDDEPRDECDSVPSDYRPTEFVTDALQHSKVKLTWDMHPDEVSRKENIKRAFSGSRAEIEENDMRAYLASSDSEPDDDNDEPANDVANGEPKLSKRELARQKMREALGLSTDSAPNSSKSAPVGELEMTFTLNDKDGEKDKEDSPDREETTVEKYMRKEREKKLRKKEKVLAKREGTTVAEEEVEEEPVAQDGEDLGFDDPFFTTEEQVKPTKSSQRKEERLKKREAKEAEAKKNAEERAALEKVMGTGSKDSGKGHFDMAEISRAEKQKTKKGKSKKKQKGGEDQATVQDDFKVDADDDRFKAVFESHEYAIDPSNPKFSTTPGMKQLLDRKKRSYGEEGSSRDTKKMRRR
ncbi:hypothetical protein BKA67DRAFT_544187 [Truncatella angustata]|uniref:NUC153 domain-containing protein n=1 Tax=Truncatella angustata TaxID=152316 RepID=A0A9P8UWL4_9PEZI|nr:uncharacterized protein BKA67DRAFT_544187 [Truncatella angustata]KAH6659346.1 hypothetical protein BKA67DRAFT_544187 [Truncatella angustata]